MTFFCGTVTGVALLSKNTLLILPIVYLISIWVSYHKCGTRKICSVFLTKYLCIGLLVWFVLNSAYLFTGTFTKLGDFEFKSQTLSGVANESLKETGNRFSDTILASFPVPFPKDYIHGIDLQKYDFETGLGGNSYLMGEFSDTGWYSYYLIAGLFKLPLGTLAIFLVAVLICVFRKSQTGNCVTLLTFALLALIFVSWNNGFSRHFRYVFPCLPAIYIISTAVLCNAGKWDRIFCVTMATASCLSSLMVYPHSISYFNELCGGPKNGPGILLDSNIDWGQDVLFLKEWVDSHERELTKEELYIDIHYGVSGAIPPNMYGIESKKPVYHERLKILKIRHPESEMHSHIPLGWYAVSVNIIYSQNGTYDFLKNFTPVAYAGYSIYIYHITEDEVNRVRNELGLPILKPDL